MAEEQPQTKRTYTTDLPAWLIALIIAAGVAGYFLSSFLQDRSKTATTTGDTRPVPYVVRCVVGSTDAPIFEVASPGISPNSFATSSMRNQVVFGEIRDGQRTILLTVEVKSGGMRGCGVLTVTGEHEAMVEWVSDSSHAPGARRWESRRHTTGTTEWDVPCRVSDD